MTVLRAHEGVAHGPGSRTLPRTVAVVGAAGHQGKEYLDAVGEIDGVSVVGVVDPARAAVPTGHRRFDSTAQMLAEVVPDVAIVAVPHAHHVDVTLELLAAGCHVLKEKPLATTVAAANALVDAARRADRGIVTLTQRPYQPLFHELARAVGAIGDPYWLAYTYAMSFERPTQGWRSVAALAHGGVLLDMGYHVIDVLQRMFGDSEVLAARRHYRYGASRRERLEDLVSAKLSMRDGSLTADVTIARHAHTREESVVVHGTHGVATVDVRRGELVVYDRSGKVMSQFSGKASNDRAGRAEMLAQMMGSVVDPERAGRDMEMHVMNVRTCDAVYQACRHRPRARTSIV